MNVFFVHKNQMVRSTLSVWILFLYKWCEQTEKPKNSSLLRIRYQFPHHWHWMRYYSGKNAPDMHTHIQNNHRKTCGSLLRKWMSRHHITLVGSRFRSKFIILPEFKIEKSRKNSWHKKWELSKFTPFKHASKLERRLPPYLKQSSVSLLKEEIA